ncbi:MAG: IctB family putative bicarbonate transporter [Chroococcidiopsidaceae cyanobacterium CP_BM_ER_R8_30]|nr:IctB family putative bicarbonate transporter [Chroococcidiopsidaceae cyanobacterium CP_BM_ER_R8_30]
MLSVWQALTLSHVSFSQWQDASYIHRLLVGRLRSWRQSSWLFQWADLLAALLIGLVLSLTPFVSRGLLLVLLVASASFWAMLTLADATEPKKTTPIYLLILLYWGIATVSTALSPVKLAALNGWLELTLYLLLFALGTRVLRSPRLRSWLIVLYLHVALVISVYGLQQGYFGASALATWVDPESPMSHLVRVYSYLGNPNLLAGYLLSAIALSLVAVFAWSGWLPKALALTMFVVNTDCLFLTYSRGGWIGFAAMLVVLLVLLGYWLSPQLPPIWRRWSRPLLLSSLIIVFLLAAISVVFVKPVQERFLSIFAGRGDSSNNFRINVWTAVVQMIHERPLFGIGPGHNAFNKIYPIYQVPRFSALSAYSILLEVAVETGLIGLASFVWLLIVTFNQAVQQLVRSRQLGHQDGLWLIGAIAALVGTLAHGTVDTVWYRPEINTVWWLLVALIASYGTNSFSLPVGYHADLDVA